MKSEAALALLQPGLTIVIAIIVASNWPYVARIIRGQVLSLREKEFVEAAHAAGLKCLALAHSRPLDELRQAEWVFRGFNDIDMKAIARAFKS